MPTYERGKHFVLPNDYAVQITKRRGKYEWAVYKGLDYRNVIVAGESNTPAKAKTDALRALDESLEYLQCVDRNRRDPPRLTRKQTIHPAFARLSAPVKEYLIAFYGGSVPQHAHNLWVELTPAQRRAANRAIDKHYYS